MPVGSAPALIVRVTVPCPPLHCTQPPAPENRMAAGSVVVVICSGLLTWIASDFVASPPKLSTARTPKVQRPPVTVGVPLICPPDDSVRPGGSALAAGRTDHVIGA